MLGDLGIELLAFNGEDYYSAPGQIAYLKTNQAELADYSTKYQPGRRRVYPWEYGIFVL